jgi:flavin reductase (DIM6/NTAB) family NADH-FMN oxidoreductase RutF
MPLCGITETSSDAELVEVVHPEDYKGTLGVLGLKSGRDIDKMHSSGLTAKEVSGSMTFEEAEVTLVCRKLFCQRLDPKNMKSDIAKQFYDGDAEHDMYIGEVVDIIR